MNQLGQQQSASSQRATPASARRERSASVSRRWHHAVPLLVTVALCWLLAGCNACSSEWLAELSAAQGDLQRDEAESVGQWEATQTGARFDFGDGVRTLAGATGTVTFDDGALMKLDPQTTIRFSRFAPGKDGRGIEVEAGNAVLEAGSNELRMHTSVGLAVLQPGTSAQISRGEKGLRFFVSVGLARLEGDGKTVEVNADHGVEVGIGMAILDEFGAETDEPEAAPTATASAPPPVDESNLPIVATLDGSAVKIRRPGSKRFESIASGEHTLDPGTQLKLTSKDSAVVRRGSTKASMAGPGTYVVVGEGPRVVEPVAGGMTVSADGQDVAAEIPGGKVTALGSEGLSIGDVNIAGNRTVTVRARAGRVRVDVGDKSSTLSAGETAQVSKGTISIQGRGVAFADIVTGAGGSLLIHDPNPPTAVGITFGDKCDHLGVVEQLSGSRTVASAVGKGSANLHFDAGQRTYALRCLSAKGQLGPIVAKGKITVYRDAGTSALPSKAPNTNVNTDGRSYTVLYQNLLPAISVRWPNAPPAPSYTLTVTSGGASSNYTVKTASFSFAPGKLREGRHTFQFRSSQGRSSRPSHATIRFDNAAPKASIMSPSEGGFSPGASVRVAGIALPGWEVRAKGASLPLDSEQRFSASVGAGPRGLVLQFSHPARGTHHYLRRAAGVPR